MFSSSVVQKVLVILYSFLVPIEVWASLPSPAAVPSKSVEIRLENDVAVNGDAVVLGDVATIYAKSIHAFKALSSLTISKFPGDQQELRLPQAYLASRIREVLPEGTEFALHAPELVVFRQEKVGISPADFAKELIRMGRAEGRIPEWAEVEVEPVSGFDQIRLWKLAQARIEPSSQMARWKGDLSFRISESEKTDPAMVWVRVKVRWFAEAWVAKRHVNILSRLHASDFSKARIEITSLREDPILAAEDLSEVIASARVRRSVQAGSPLTAAAIERAPDAKPGQPLKVVFISESGIRVTTEGALLGSGSIGNEVRAKLRASRKVVTGKLVSGGVMEVSL